MIIYCLILFFTILLLFQIFNRNVEGIDSSTTSPPVITPVIIPPVPTNLTGPEKTSWQFGTLLELGFLREATLFFNEFNRG